MEVRSFGTREKQGKRKHCVYIRPITVESVVAVWKGVCWLLLLPTNIERMTEGNISSLTCKWPLKKVKPSIITVSDVCWHIKGSFTKDGISHSVLTPRPPACVNKERPRAFNFGPFETWRWWFSSIQPLQVVKILILPRQCWKFATEWHHRN